MKFYHVFQSGTARIHSGSRDRAEFNSDQPEPGVKPVDGNEVFRRLELDALDSKIQPIAGRENQPRGSC